MRAKKVRFDQSVDTSFVCGQQHIEPTHLEAQRMSALAQRGTVVRNLAQGQKRATLATADVGNRCFAAVYARSSVGHIQLLPDLCHRLKINWARSNLSTETFLAPVDERGGLSPTDRHRHTM